MNKKELTDEEIVKALEICKTSSIKGCDGCPFDTLSYCDEITINALNLINRQKAEIERLTEERKTANMHDLMYWFNAYKECADDCEKYVIEASDNKAECIRLQKQVDELKEERENMQTEIIATEEKRLQAVKDTAEKYYRKMRTALGILCFGNNKIHKENGEIAKEFGVEVE